MMLDGGFAGTVMLYIFWIVSGVVFWPNFEASFTAGLTTPMTIDAQKDVSKRQLRSPYVNVFCFFLTVELVTTNSTYAEIGRRLQRAAHVLPFQRVDCKAGQPEPRGFHSQSP